MLSLDRPVSAAGLSLYADHHDEGTYHYLPGSPVILVQPDGKPSLRLQVFRGGADGGLLWADVVLKHPAGALERAADELKQRANRDISLVPALFHEGSVHIALLDTKSAPAAPSSASSGTSAEAAEAAPARTFLVEQILATTKPSLLGDQRAIFSARLDPEGAVLLEASLRDGVLPAAIVYDLAYRGLRPASGLRATLRNKLAYDYLRAQGAVDSLWFRADLSREVENLQKQGLLTIEDVDFSGRTAPDPAARQEEILRELREWIELVFFRSAVSPALPGAQPTASPSLRAAWSDGGFARGAFVLRSLHQEEEQDLIYDRSVTSVAEARIAPQGLLLLPSNTSADDIIQRIDLERPPLTRTIHGFVPDGANWEGVTSITLDVQGQNEVRSAVFDPAHTEHNLTVPAGDVGHRLRGQFVLEDDSIGKLAPPADAFLPCLTDHLSIDPAQAAGRRVVRVVALNLGPGGMSGFSGTIETGGRQQALHLTATQPEVSVAIWNGGPLHVKGDFRSASGTIPWDGTFPPSEPVLLLRTPGSFHTVAIQRNDPLERYAAVFVEIEAPGGGARQSFRLDSVQTSALWTTTRAGTESTFRYRTRRMLRDGSVQEDPWKQGDGSLLVAGDTGIRTETIDIVWLGPPLLGGLLKLSSLAPPSGISGDVELMFDETSGPLRAVLPFSTTGERRYSVQGQVFTEIDTIDITPHEDTAEVLLLSPA